MARIILKGISGCLRGEVFLLKKKGSALLAEQKIAISRSPGNRI